MQQAQEVKGLEQVEAWGEMAGDAGGAAALLRAQGDFAYAKAVVREFPTILEPPAFRKDVQSAGPL